MLRDLPSTNEQGNKAQDSESKSDEVHEMYRKYCGKNIWFWRTQLYSGHQVCSVLSLCIKIPDFIPNPSLGANSNIQICETLLTEIDIKDMYSDSGNNPVGKLQEYLQDELSCAPELPSALYFQLSSLFLSSSLLPKKISTDVLCLRRFPHQPHKTSCPQPFVTTAAPWAYLSSLNNRGDGKKSNQNPIMNRACSRMATPPVLGSHQASTTSGWLFSLCRISYM